MNTLAVIRHPKPAAIRYVALLMTVVLAVGCSPRVVTIEESNETFSASNRNPAEVLEQLRRNNPDLDGLSGRGRVQVSMPGSTERSTIVFTSDRQRSLLIFRNSLGIETGRLLVEPDSVTLYNRIENYVQRVSTANQDVLLDNGFYAVNMLNVLSPDFETLRPRTLLESEDSWMITFEDRSRMVFRKSDGNLTRVEYHLSNPTAFSSYLFADSITVNGYELPRNIQILSNDRQSAIYLTVQDYQVNPAGLNLDPGIPPNTTVFP